MDAPWSPPQPVAQYNYLAEELEVQVMQTSLKVLGEEHPSTLTSMGNLASTYWN
jgi:hypothetical protein